MKTSTRTRRLRHGVIAVVMIVLAAVSACGGSGDDDSAGSDGTIKLTFGNQGGPTLTFLPIRVAIDKGYFKEEGIQLDVLDITNPGALGAALESGSIDVAGDAISPVANSFQKGIDLRLFAGMTSEIDQQLVVAKDSGIPIVGQDGATWKDSFAGLKGKTLGLPGVAGFTGPIITALAKDAGIDPNDFTMVETAPGGPQIAALASGQSDASMGASAFSFAAEGKGVGEIAVDLGRDIPEYFQGATPNAMFTLEKTLVKYPELATKWQAAIDKAIAVINDPANKDYLHKLATSEVGGLPPSDDFAELDDIIARLTPTYTSKIVPDNIDKFLDFAIKVGLLKGKISAADLLAK